MEMDLSRFAGSDIHERIGEGGSASEIARAEGIPEARGIAKILQLTLFRIAIPVHAKTAADNKFMRTRSAEQTGGAGARRPGETQARAKVIVFCGDAARVLQPGSRE